MNSYTVYLQNGMWGAPVVKADDYVTQTTELGLCVKFYREDAIVAEFTSVLGIVRQDTLVAQQPFGAAFND